MIPDPYFSSPVGDLSLCVWDPGVIPELYMESLINSLGTNVNKTSIIIIELGGALRYCIYHSQRLIRRFL